MKWELPRPYRAKRGRGYQIGYIAARLYVRTCITMRLQERASKWLDFDAFDAGFAEGAMDELERKRKRSGKS